MSVQSADAFPRLHNLPWYKSSRCDINGSCVEVAPLAPHAPHSRDEIAVRDGKIGMGSPTLTFGGLQWQAFVSGVVEGFFDLA
jgi:hypothetical protein